MNPMTLLNRRVASVTDPIPFVPVKNGKHVLVTGGAGYIGSHTVRQLLQEGYDVTIYDDMRNGDQDITRWIAHCELGCNVVSGDLADTDLLKKTLSENKIDAVVHFAADAYVGESVKDPLKYSKNNIGGTTSLLEAMNDAGVKDIVFSSTCATYGEPDKMPITEDTPQEPINPYGRSKLAIEQTLIELTSKDVAPENALNHAVALRYFNAAGAGEGLVENHDDHHRGLKCPHVIPRVINAARDRKDHKGNPVTFGIFGDDYDTPDRTAIRDYIHVEDLASAHVLALGKMLEDKTDAPKREFTAINLGTANGTSVQEIVAAAKRTINSDFNPEIQPRRQGDPPILVGDNKKAKEELGWEPRHSDIDNIVKTADEGLTLYAQLKETVKNRRDMLIEIRKMNTSNRPESTDSALGSPGRISPQEGASAPASAPASDT